MRRQAVAVAVLAGLGLGAATVFQATAIGTGAKAATAAPGAAVARDRRLAAEGRVLAYPGAQVKVAAERTGRVLRVAVQEGDLVRAGDVLVELDAEELRASVAEAEAKVSESEAEIRLARIEEGRRQELVAEEVVPAKDLDQSHRDLDVATARRDTAQAEVTRLRAQLKKMRVVAPLSGTVVGRSVEPGETVEAGTLVATVADLARLRVEGEADEADAAGLAVGAPAVITALGYPGQSWRGVVEDVARLVTIRRIKPQDPSRPTDTRVIAVKVAFAEPVPLRLGTTVELAVDTAPAR